MQKFFVVCECDCSEMGQVGDVLMDNDYEIVVCLRKGEHAYEKTFIPSAYTGLIVLGGDGFDEEKEIGWIRDALDHSVPMLGICYGAQLLAICRNGSAKYSKDQWNERELEFPHRGLSQLDLTPEGKVDQLTFHINKPEAKMCQWHSYKFTYPKQDILLAMSDDSSHPDAFRVRNSLSYGLQFHPEVPRGCIQEWANGAKFTIDERRRIAAIGRDVIQEWVSLILNSSKGTDTKA